MESLFLNQNIDRNLGLSYDLPDILGEPLFSPKNLAIILAMSISQIKLFNTLTRSIEPFTPRVQGNIGIYCCGPTVYNFQHIGNLKTYIFEDVLVRTLRRAGYQVKHVMNITDVGHLVSDADDGEDKMLVAMRREKKKSHEIAQYYTDIFFDDCQKLNIKRPDIVCKATDHIQEMIELSKKIEANGYAYFSNGNLYFDVARFPEYGKLALLKLDTLQAGARIEVDEHKRSPQDFVLWFTKSKFENQELQWDSPWGKGYPGWHIECSAMAVKYLGEQFDIHCGGIDHIPVHHTNEIAQTEAATGKKPWVSVWMHSDFMVINKQKMSKSSGGFITLKDLIGDGVTPEAYRYFCLTASYRSQLNFSMDALSSAGDAVKKLRSVVIRLKSEAGPEIKGAAIEHPRLKDFNDALFNDLNTPQALAEVWNVVNSKEIDAVQKLSLLYSMDDILGLGINTWHEEGVEIPPDIANLLKQREDARKAKNWAESDRIRDQILSLGFIIEDSKEGINVRAK